MATWVITIDRDFPQHWGIAAENRVWDYPRPRKVQAGDELYFWQSGGTFVGRATAKDDAFPLPNGASLPWVDDGERTYTTRVDLQWAEGLPPVKIQPGTTLAELKRKLNFSTGRPLEDRFAQALAATYGEPVSDPTGDPEDAEAVDLQQVLLSEEEISALGVDERRRVVVGFQTRREQRSQFRRQLLDRDGGCVVTRVTTEAVLEAAHIEPYKGVHSNALHNGLILRADIHRMFDRHQLTLEYRDDQLFVRINPAVVDQAYLALEGAPAHLAQSPHKAPSRQLLQLHNSACNKWWSPL